MQIFNFFMTQSWYFMILRIFPFLTGYLNSLDYFFYTFYFCGISYNVLLFFLILAIWDFFHVFLELRLCQYSWSFKKNRASLVAQMVKKPACERPRFNPWVRKIPWRRKRQPTPVFLPGKSHGQRSQVGYSPWGCKESDTTEQLHFHFSPSCIGEGNGIPL